MTATLTFNTRDMATKFARAWSFYSLTGHTIGAGSENVCVTLYDVNESQKEWISEYIGKL